MDSNAAQQAAKILAAKGAKLHANGMHLRRTANGGYIAQHELTDKNGNPPMDGQRSSAEYALADHAALMKHIGEHMAPPTDDDDVNSDAR